MEADDILFGLNIQQFILQHQSALMDTRKVTKRSCSCEQGQAEHGSKPPFHRFDCVSTSLNARSRVLWDVKYKARLD